MATRSRKNHPKKPYRRLEKEIDKEIEIDDPALQRYALRAIKYKCCWAAGIGLLPLPIIDFVGVTAVQLSLLRELSALYGVPYYEDRAREWIGALVGGLCPTLVKSIPGFGSLIGVLTGPVYYGASTYAIGRVFLQHFETGGTFFSFDPDEMRSYFDRYFREGRDEAAEARDAA
jgi:uncharacterized protein (DUF697 family)